MNSGRCECEPCWAGKGCNAECGGHGACVNGTSCECEPGWWGDKCEVRGCPGEGISCTGHGVCNSANQVTHFSYSLC